jgi:hypothetical protein
MDKHPFKNTHKDRDCVDCGKPESDPIHRQKQEEKPEATKAESEKKHLF